MNVRRILLSILGVYALSNCNAQSLKDYYKQFQEAAVAEYSGFRDECNRKYAEHLRGAWEWFEDKAPLPLPDDLKPIPPKPYKDKDDIPVTIKPVEVVPINEDSQPKPIAPIREVPNDDNDYFIFDFYGVTGKVRLLRAANIRLKDLSPNSIASGWEVLRSDELNNAIRDCLETRIRYNLCDWAYLNFLEKLSHSFCNDKNGASLLLAFLFSQSGYQMRLGVDNNLVVLYGSKHQIFDKGYFIINNLNFYPLSTPSNKLQICNAEFEGETPLSLYISKEQLLGKSLSSKRLIESGRYADLKAQSQVPEQVIEFYNTYPSSMIGTNQLTRWAMYANTPLAQKTKEILYPALSKAIEGLAKREAAEKLLNWVQTGFVYEYDDKVWGHDRAFFAEETLYYPYADCEDRSILFSILIRDLLGLDVALIYYPGHLATAVCFDEVTQGSIMMINGRKFTVCDPTYIGAPVGAQMPGLEYNKAEAIVLE